MDPLHEHGASLDSRLEQELSDLCVSRLEASGRPWRERANHRDEHAFSCMQAARVRDRLGSGANGGIPLWAELKSIMGVAVSADKARTVPFAAHTRANTTIDPDRLLRALGLDPTRASIRSFLDEDEEYPDHPLATIAKATRERWFGLVNPFTVDYALSDFAGEDLTLSDVIQVFDASVLLDGGLPDTVMTNLGARGRAMEIPPADLIAAVRSVSPAASVDAIAVPCSIWLGLGGTYRKDVFMYWPPPAGPRIGILTGNGPESGVSLWRAIVTAIRKTYPHVPDVFMPDVAIRSIPDMGLSMDLVSREAEVREIVLDGVRGLLESGCKLVTVACNTTIYFESDLAALCAEFGARFVSIAEAAIPAVRRALDTQPSGTGVSVIGIGPVIDLAAGFSGYRRHLEAAGIEVATCPADEFAFAIKNQPEERSRVAAFAKLIKGLPADTGVVVLALTEASLVYPDYAPHARKRDDHRVYVDALGELGRYVAFNYLLAGYLESDVCQIADALAVEDKLRDRFGWSREHRTATPEAATTP
jgi:aspartate racemase